MSDQVADKLVLRTFAKLDKLAFGIAVGTVLGFAILATTIAVVVKGGDPVGPRLWLLVHYFPGYSVSIGGAFVGLCWGFASGFVLGFVFAVLRNAFLFMYVAGVRARAELDSLHDFIDHV